MRDIDVRILDERLRAQISAAMQGGDSSVAGLPSSQVWSVKLTSEAPLRAQWLRAIALELHLFVW